LIYLCDACLQAGKFEDVVRWVELDIARRVAENDPETEAYAHHLLGAAYLHSDRSLTEAERHMVAAARLAGDHRLPHILGRSRFGQGNILAQRGDTAGAVAAYREAIPMCRAGNDLFHEIMGHNNLAYHSMLLGDLDTAHEHIERAIALAEERAFPSTAQWLYSTRGEIALAEQRWEEADAWFRRGLAEVEKLNNREMHASYRANLGLAARGKGDWASAVALLEAARQDAPVVHQKARIDLWLAETYAQQGDRAAALAALDRAEAQFQPADRAALRLEAERLRARLSES
jgi:tetratricopeptide (TPR) repeat protein